MSVTPSRVPVTVLTGFLGSGKTTLLNRILSEKHGKRIAVIENEFGEVGVDSELVIGAEEELFETNNGCICCTVRGDLIRILGQLMKRRDRFDYILIETTGMADPGPVAQTFFLDDDLKNTFQLDAIVTMVDAKHFEQHVDELNEPAEQVAFADLVLLNKTDLLGDTETRKLSRDLSLKLRPGARLVTARHGQLSPAALIGLDAAAEGDLAARRSHHEIEGIAEHDHDDFESFVVPLGTIPDRGLLIETIAALVRRHDILRLKGFVALDRNPSRLVVQAVGPRVNHWFDRPWRDGEERRSSLVVIGLKGLDRARIERELTA